MKYDCANEFNLEQIYRKLTTASKPLTVKACEFFAPQPSLKQLQAYMNKIFARFPSKTNR